MNSPEEWFDATCLLIEDDPPLPRFHLDGVDEAPFDLVRVAQDDAPEPTIQGLRFDWIPGVPCLTVGAALGGVQ